MSEPAESVQRRDLVEGLGKGLKVIECFDDQHPRRTPSEVGEATGITRTAARRYLLSLVHYGYAETDGRHFWLTPRVLRLGHSYLEAARLPRLVQPFIQRISMQCGETVNFSVLDGHEVVYLARSNPPRLVSIGYHVGARMPAHAVTPGIAILSTFPESRVNEWIAEHEFSSFTAATVTDAERFREHLRSARALGYWMTEAQVEPGLCGIAMPLVDRHGEVRGAVGMTLQSANYTSEAMVQKLLPLLREATQALRQLV
jgi:IclR family pca regulon transcriptional regulator